MESSALQASVGKLLFGIKIINGSNGKRISLAKAFHRNVFKYILGLILSPLIMLKNDKRCFHDNMAGTIVIKKKDLPHAKKIITRDKNKLLKGYVICLVVVLFVLLVLLFRYSVMNWYKLRSASMTPTIQIGDNVFVDKLAYDLRFPLFGKIKKNAEPKRGDVVIFMSPIKENKVYIKRIVGLPGDKIKIEDDKLSINGELIIKQPVSFYPAMYGVTAKEGEQFSSIEYGLFMENIKEAQYRVLQIKDRSKTYLQFNMETIVPENSFFVMGDNRDNSEDSRTWGFIKRDAIIGKPISVFFPLSRFGEKIK